MSKYKGQIPICHIEFMWPPKGTSEMLRPTYSVDETFATIDHIAATESEPASANEPAAWATVVLRRRDGNRMHVGRSDIGWLLILLRTQSSPARISMGNLPPGPRIVFLVPEWTDFDRSHIIDADRGTAAVRMWLEGGDPSAMVPFRP